MKEKSILKDFIHHISFNEFLPAENDDYIPVIPDGMTELVINMGEEYSRKNGLTKDEMVVCSSHLIAQKTTFSLVKPGPNMRTISIRFKPGALAFFSKIDFKQLNDQVVDAEHIFGKAIHSLEDQLYNTREKQKAIHIIEEFLLRKYMELHHGKTLKQYIYLLYTSPSEKNIGWMIRTKSDYKRLERLFVQSVGITPKILSQIIRLNYATKLLGSRNGKNMTQVGLEAGYFDQPHFIRQFRKYAGLTPRSYQKIKYQMVLNNQKAINMLFAG